MQTGSSPASYSTTRWWSKFEVIQHLFNAFRDVSTFLNSDGLPAATSSKLLEIRNDPAKHHMLKMELAITADAMEPFAKATYALEGDDALAVTTYERVSMLYSVISTEHYPNVNAAAS